MFQVFGWVGVEGARLRIITTFINSWSQLHVRVWLIFKLCKGFGRKSSKAIKRDGWNHDWTERGMVRFSLLTVLGPLNKGQEETWISRDDQPVSWGRTGHCNVRSKAKSKGQNYPNLHKNVRRTCSHQKQQILLFSLQLQVITIYR